MTVTRPKLPPPNKDLLAPLLLAARPEMTLCRIDL